MFLIETFLIETAIHGFKIKEVCWKQDHLSLVSYEEGLAKLSKMGKLVVLATTCKAIKHERRDTAKETLPYLMRFVHEILSCTH